MNSPGNQSLNPFATSTLNATTTTTTTSPHLYSSTHAPTRTLADNDNGSFDLYGQQIFGSPKHGGSPHKSHLSKLSQIQSPSSASSSPSSSYYVPRLNLTEVSAKKKSPNPSEPSIQKKKSSEISAKKKKKKGSRAT
eukprot:m.219409 g.219409  ORF g.219409 m.219409 type:complete len:137 (-) comp33292_c7_seq1:59-469(-)